MKCVEADKYYDKCKTHNNFLVRILTWLIFTHLVLFDLFLRRKKIKQDEWYWADLILMKNNLSPLKPIYSIKHLFNIIIPHWVVKFKLSLAKRKKKKTLRDPDDYLNYYSSE